MVTVLLEYIDLRYFFYGSPLFQGGLSKPIIFLAYYAGIMLDAFSYLICLTLCWHNRLVPTPGNSLAWPDRFFPFLFVVAEKRVWSGSHTHLVLAPPTVVGGVNRGNVIKT